MRRLQRRDGMLVDELDLPAALEQQRELVEAGDVPCSITPLTRNTVIGSLLARGGGKEQVLERRACLPARLASGRVASSVGRLAPA